MILLLFGFLLLSYLQSVESASVQVPIVEIDSLYDLFISTNGNAWNWNNKSSGVRWNFESSPCLPSPSNWQGVSCNCVVQGNLINCNVISLNLSSHNLNGRLPFSIGNLSSLENISLSNNRIIGIVPPTLYNLKSLSIISLNNNNLTGSISYLIKRCKSLKLLSLHYNLLTGPLPVSIGNITIIEFIDLSFNHLFGSLPSSFSNLINLKYLDVSDNYLTGSIASLFESMTNLVSINLNNNKFSGSIPDITQTISSLISLSINYNSLSHSIPSTIFKLTNLQLLDLSFNQLSGTLPDSLGYLYKMQNLTLKSNLFTGSIPTSLSLIEKLRVLNIRNNLLGGSLSPILIENMKYLFDLKINNNFLTGSIPSLYNIYSLQVLLLNNNFFSGSLEGVFNYHNHTLLTTILIAYNQLTGVIPSEIFLLPKLETFVAGSNCLTNTLPSSMCEANSLVTLSLDGMHSSLTCQQFLIPLLSSSYTISDQNGGSIPICIFNLTSIRTLHITGNLFQGDLPNQLSLGSHLVDLAMSYNLLYGSIPITIQNRKWLSLDLSYNKFTGVLSDNFSEQYYLEAKVDLEVNRLSDNIPNALLSLTNIHILTGNIFQCSNYNRNQVLPQNDPDLSIYECGSNSFNLSVYIWLLCMLLLGTVIVLFRIGRIPKCLLDIFNTIAISGINDESLNTSKSDIEDLPSVLVIKYNLNEILKIAFIITVYIVVILLPIYGACSIYYGTYEYLYGFVISGAFKSGISPFIILFIFLNLLVIIFLFYSFKTIYNERNNTSNSKKYSSYGRKTETLKQRYSRYLVFWTLIPFLNFVIVGGVNFLYIYLTIYEPNADLIIYQILLAMFKSIWNGYGFRYLSRFIFHYFPYVDSSSSEYRFIQLFVTLFNNIAIPCFIVAIISKDCLYNVFVTPDTISTSYEYIQCSQFLEDSCYGNPADGDIVTKNTSYIPPFYYSYQCSSRFITFYAPAYMFLCIITILNPVIQTTLGLIDAYINKNRTKVNKRLLILWESIPIPRILRSFHEDSTVPENLSLHPYFDCSHVFVMNFLNVCLLMTFGALFPPVGIAFMINIYSYNIYTKWTVTRFLVYAVHHHKNEYIDIIGKECTEFYKKKLAKRTIWLVTTFCCCFYSVFLFDALGDSIGFGRSYWVLIFMCLLPVFYYCIYKTIKYIIYPNVTRLSNENIYVKLTEKDSSENIEDPIVFY